jgi:TolB-like protein/tetratricopeptide (TPR) repeat protein
MVRRGSRLMNDPGQTQSPIYEFSGFRLDVARRQLRSKDDQPANLTVKVFDLLLYLVEHQGELVEKSTLMQAVWPNVVVEENNLNQNISVLRKALGERAGEHRFIMTVPGRGFRFVAPVTVAQGNRSVAGARSAAAQPSTMPRIAIMPFENLSPDPANAFFADGLHDEILATLAQRAPDLQVISRTTMMRYRAHPAPLPQIAAELNANYVIEGTVRRESDQVRVTLQLIDARDDRHLWAHSYERTLKSALTLQCEVASDVASRLAARFHGDTVAPPTRNPEAYDLYLRARLLTHQVTPVSPPQQFAEIEALFDRAIVLDPEFAVAYANRAGFGDARFGFNYETSDELLQKIRADLETARRLAPRDPFVLAAEAGHLSWVERDLPRALATFQAAMDAGLADSVYFAGYSVLLQRLGRNEESYAFQMRAVAMDPANPFILAAASLQLASLLRIDEAIRMADRGIELYPDRPFLKLVRAQVIYNFTGNPDELRRELTKAARHVPAVFLLDLSFLALMNTGEYDELQAILDSIPEREIRAVPGPGGGGPLFCVGRRPLAQYRGWLALARGDLPEAARCGVEILEFVVRQEIRVRNDWFLKLLTADGYALQGRREEAIAAARAAVAALPISRDRFGAYTAARAAFVLAICGAADDAMNLLESLFEFRAVSGIGPILRNSRLAAALAGNARYHALKTRIEEEMLKNSVY